VRDLSTYVRQVTSRHTNRRSRAQTREQTFCCVGGREINDVSYRWCERTHSLNMLYASISVDHEYTPPPYEQEQRSIKCTYSCPKHAIKTNR